MFLNEKLFQRVATLDKQMDSLGLDAESRRLLDVYYKRFVHEGASLPPAEKAKLSKLNEEESTLMNDFRSKLLTATKAAAYTTKDKAALKGLSDAQLAAAAEAAKDRKVEGYVLPLQNTTQQPILVSLADRATRQAVFADSWTRAERGGTNDTRATIARLAKLRAEKAALLGHANFAAWNLEDQMAKTPEAAEKFMDALVPMASQPTEMAARNWMLRRMMLETIRNDPDYNGGNYTAQPRMMKYAIAAYRFASAGGTLGYQTLAPTAAKADKMVDEQLALPVTADANDFIYQWEASHDYNPSTGLERIEATLLAINAADDERNPAETGVTDAALKRVKNGRLYLIPASTATRGHLTTGNAAFYRQQLQELLQTAPQRTM